MITHPHSRSGSFHSTDCPSEWGLEGWIDTLVAGHTVSIQLIAPASGALRRLLLERVLYGSHFYSFHSTDCPSEWGLAPDPERELKLKVSIQLIAPASGAPPKPSIPGIF